MKVVKVAAGYAVTPRENNMKKTSPPKSAIGKSPQKSTPGKSLKKNLPTVETSTKSNSTLPGARPFIVGIGASAGGLSALEDFFAGMPQYSINMGIVVIQHLDAKHESILATLIQRFTKMKVTQALDGEAVLRDHVYIIPPGQDMTITNSTLRLVAQAVPRQVRYRPIDQFFSSLAADQQDFAVGVILSGTGTDGTDGCAAIKLADGWIFCQSPSSAEFDGMPLSALYSGHVDYEMRPSDMPNKMVEIMERQQKNDFALPVLSNSADQKILTQILKLVTEITGHDFSAYKSPTILRRLARRMQQVTIASAAEYLTFLRSHPDEAQALFAEVLIGVTSFFRDRDSFSVLENDVIPQILSSKVHGSKIRVWCVGCSTGQEAYSIGMLLTEQVNLQNEGGPQRIKIEIFATDIDPNAISAARAGVYSKEQLDGVSPQRLNTFFSPIEGTDNYQVNKLIRELVIFSVHDVNRDPPFSKMDLISCRNVMIYFTSTLQIRMLTSFYCGLTPNGFLFLGTSEGLGEHADDFIPVDRHVKIFKCAANMNRPLPDKILLSAPQSHVAQGAISLGDAPTLSPAVSLRSRVQAAMVARLTASGIVVTRSGNIVYLHGRTGMYLEPQEGEVHTSNLFKMCREGLQTDLAVALNTCVASNEIVDLPKVRVRTNGHFTLVNITVGPLSTLVQPSDTPLYLIVIVPQPEDAVSFSEPTPLPGTNSQTHTDGRIKALQKDLELKDRHLRITISDMDLAAEEIKSSNEEMQSINEELQSTNEELETSKEELQFVNEELSTANSELEVKASDSEALNNDMLNFVNGTGMAIIFLDLHSQILRFTPAAQSLIRILPSDVGRAISDLDLSHGLGDLQQTVREVLADLKTRDFEVIDSQGKDYKMRVLPYRTVKNRIEGAVIFFTDISNLKRAQRSLTTASDGLKMATHIAKIGLWHVNPVNGAALFSPEVLQLVGIDPARVLTRTELFELIPVDHRSILNAKIESSIKFGTPWDTDLPITSVTGQDLWLRSYGNAIMTDGKVTDVHAIFQDITEHKLAEEQLRQDRDLLRLAVVVRDASDAITVQDLHGRTLAWNPGATRLYGWSESEALAMNVRERIPAELREGELSKLTELSRQIVLQPYHTRRIAKNGTILNVTIVSTALVNEQTTTYAIATTERAT